MNTYAYVLNNPINWFDPYGLWTVGISFNVSGGAGLGGTGGMNFVFGYGENGFSADIQQVIGGGSCVGASGGFSVGLEVTNADNVSDLCGIGYQIGGSAGEVGYIEGNVFGGEGYQGLYLGIGLGGGTPGAGYGFVTNTSSMPMPSSFAPPRGL